MAHTLKRMGDCQKTYFVELKVDSVKRGGISVFTDQPELTEEIVGLIESAPALKKQRDDLLAACEELVADKDYLEQDEGIFACQCEPRGRHLAEPPKCSYCKAKAAIED